MELRGLYTALITPFDEKGEFNEEGYRENIKHQIKSGVDGIVPVGTTGESAVLSEEEHQRVINVAIDQAKGRVQVVAGSGSNNTKEALSYTKYVEEAGADAALIITPYYNKPTQGGLIKHYSTIAAEVDIPIVLYTVPSRTGINILPETTKELSKIRNIVAIKDASGNLDQVMKVIMTCKDFTVLSGDDNLTYPMITLGAGGVISVASNIAPRLMSEFIHACLNEKWDKARELHYQLYPLFKVIFIETNPSPAKAALNLMGMAAGETRLPLVPVSSDSEGEIKEVLKDLDLL